MTELPSLSLERTDYLRALVESVPDALFVHDLDGRFVDVNQRACDSLGYAREELLALTVRDVERDHHLSLAEMWHRIRAGDDIRLSGRHRRRDGSSFPIMARLRALELDGNWYVCAFVRPQADDEPASSFDASRQLELNVFRELFYVASEAVAVIDHEGCYLIQNRAHERLLGYSDSELAGKTPAIHLGPQAFEEVAAELAKHGTYRGEHTSRPKGGDEIRIELSAFAVTRGPGEPPLFVGIKRELGERARKQTELMDQRTRDLEEELRQAQKMELIGRLAAGVAHDFNNLLTPILGYVDLELQRTDAPDRTRESLTEIHHAARRGRELTRQLLTFGRKQQLRKQVLDLTVLVPSAERMLRRLIAKRVEIRLEVAPRVMPVLADPTAIEQVLMNLTTNAEEAMPSGGTITIAANDLTVGVDDPLARVLGRGGAFVEISVTDEGGGMSGRTLQRAFEPFFTDKPHGTGLGLSIVHGIVRQHEGYIRVETQPGRGSKFRVILPPTDAVVNSPVARAPATGARFEQTILVAEDEPQVRQLVRRLLEDRGFRVLVARDGIEALEVAENHTAPIDLLLSDVVMPRLCGRGLFDALRDRRPDLRALFMTGYAGDALGAGFDPECAEIIEKPFSARALVERIAALLGEIDGR